MGARLEGGPKRCQMTSHTAEVELRYAMVQALEAGGLPECLSTFSDGMCEFLDLGELRYPGVIIISFVDPTSIRSDKTLLESSQFGPGVHEAKHNRFQACGPGVVLLVGIRWRGDDGIDGARQQDRVQLPRIAQMCDCGWMCRGGQGADILCDLSDF